MDQYLYHLAEIKYRMYHELYKWKAQTYTSQECYERIVSKAKYEMLLENIAMLPFDEQLKIREIEAEFFSDAPYVYVICNQIK